MKNGQLCNKRQSATCLSLVVVVMGASGVCVVRASLSFYCVCGCVWDGRGGWGGGKGECGRGGGEGGRGEGEGCCYWWWWWCVGEGSRQSRR